MLQSIKNFYEKHYKLLLIIPILLMVLSLAQIALQYNQTGDFLTKGVSLKGGITIKITDPSLHENEIEQVLQEHFPKSDIEARSLSSAGTKTGIEITIDIDVNNADQVQEFKDVLLSEIPGLTKDSLEDNLQTISPKLGDSFFKATFKALIVAFLFMALIVFYYFRSLVPSLAVILSAFNDIAVTIAITNLLGIKISIAGIGGFLMLIGYSVDTDILLATKVLKTTHGKVIDRIFRAMKTGLMMSITTLAALTVGILFTLSPDIKQIMTILLIGLLVDLTMTWFQNAGILRIYMAKKNKSTEQ